MKKSKLQSFLLEYTYNRTIDKINKYYLNNDNIIENIEGENVNEAGGVAGIPIVNDVQRLYTDLNNILETQDKHSPEVVQKVIPIKFESIGFKNLECEEHTIRIRFNDFDYGFKNIVSLPNSVFVFRIKDIKINNIVLAATFRETLGSKNYYRQQFSDRIDNGHLIKSDPETIGIDVLAVNGEICPKSFYAAFFHEFNHLFQDFQQSIKNSRRETVKIYRITNAINVINQYTELTDLDKKHITNLFKNVMNDTEINAYAAGHFGELLGSDVEPKDYKKFIEYSNVWSHIINVESAIDHILKMDDDKLKKIYDAIKATQFDELFSSDQIDEKNFKKMFRNNILKRLQKLIDATTKVAAYYFGMTAKFNNQNQKLT